MKKFIAISGNIGVGKTTLTEKLAQSLGYKAYLEPVTENPYLKDFYLEMKKFAYHSQTYFLAHCMTDHYQLAMMKKSVVADRTIYENAEVFARYLFERKFINKRDWQVYNHIYKTAVKVLPPPDIIVYLKASISKLKQRIRDRGREYEKNLTDKYLADLNNLYDEWVGNFTKSKIILINYDELDFQHRPDDFKRFLEVVHSELR